jgi:hypothetical protein
MRNPKSTPGTSIPTLVTESHELSRSPSHQQQHFSPPHTPNFDGNATVGALRTRTPIRMSRTGSMGSTSPGEPSSPDARFHSPRDMHYSGAGEPDRRPSLLDLSSTHTSTAASPTMANPYVAFQYHQSPARERSDIMAFPSPSRSPSPSTSPQGRPIYRRSDGHVYGGGNGAALDAFMGSAGANLTGAGGHSPRETNLYYGRHTNAWLFNNISFTESITESIKKGYHHLKGHAGGNGNGGAREEGGED